MSKSGNWKSRSRQKIWEVGPDPRDQALEAREEAVFPAHTTGFWVLLGPPQGTRGGTHLPRTAQLRRFGAIGPDTMLAGAKMRICPKPADSQNSSSSISPTNDRPSKC